MTTTTTATTTTTKFVSADHHDCDDQSSLSSSSSSSTNKKSVRFCLNKIVIHTIPRVTEDELPSLFYDDFEFAEFRYQAFQEEIARLYYS